MANNPLDNSISYINLGDGEGNRPISALYVGDKSASSIGKLVQTVNADSKDDEYPSASCMWEILGTLENRLKAI